MNNYKFDEETSNKISSTYEKIVEDKNLKKLIDNIDLINNNFLKIEIPKFSMPKLDRMQEIEIDPEEVKKQAEDALVSYKNEGINKINNDFEKQRNNLSQDVLDLQSSYENNKRSIKDYFQEARLEVEDNANKQGISRSSIVINQKDAFDAMELDNYNRLDKGYSEDLNALNFQLSSLSQQKNKAISDFDIAYAVKLNDKIADIDKELAKKQDEILKYNNDIAKKEQTYKDNYDKLVRDINNDNFQNNTKLMELVAKYGANAVNSYKTNRINDVLDAYFAKLTKDEIKNVLNNSELISVLGSSYQDVVRRYAG